MLAGEVCQVPIFLTNCGWKDLQSVYLATSLLEYFTVIRGVVGVRWEWEWGCEVGMGV